MYYYRHGTVGFVFATLVSLGAGAAASAVRAEGSLRGQSAGPGSVASSPAAGAPPLAKMPAMPARGPGRIT